jgi:hypothetical protein
MCCFSLPVKSVSGTKIFARPGPGHRQFLAYSMTFESEEELAMVLPLPVKEGAGEHAVTFINLKEYQDPNPFQPAGFFEDLESGFPRPPAKSEHMRGLRMWGTESAAASTLEVVRVGDFEASFVPTVKDFDRLDERFRLPAGTWEKLPQYSDYGFAVFKLKQGKLRVHPMAFSFPRRDPKVLFFPTVHIHDGLVHAKAEFDHVLYSQPSEEMPLRLTGWAESASHARSFMKLDKAAGMIEPDQHCYRKTLSGNLRNRDTLVLAES